MSVRVEMLRAKFFCTAAIRRRDLPGGKVLGWRERRRYVVCTCEPLHAGDHRSGLFSWSRGSSI